MNEHMARYVGQYLVSEDAKHQRCYMRRVVLAILLGSFVGFSILYAISARAAEISKRGNDYVRLLDAPCTNPAVVKILTDAGMASHLHAFRLAEADIAGKHYGACYRSSVRPDGLYILLFDDGDTAVLPQSEFRREGI